MLSRLKNLSPGYPALVMATGIIAVSLEQQGLDPIARVFFWLAASSYAVLAVLFALRIARFPRAVFDDISHPVTGFSFLTAVAATNVLGSASAAVYGWWGLAWALWWISLPLLAVCLYVPLLSSMFRQDPPKLQDGINGTWFLMTVGVQSVAVLGALLLRHEPSAWLAFVSHVAFGLGLVLYLLVATLIFARWTLARLDPGDVHPPAWIAAGSAAISTLAGANLIDAASGSARLEPFVPLLEGVTILTWATTVFWLPIIVAIGVWRHLVRRTPLRYEPSLWAMVFPLGMFAAATTAMFQATGITYLGPIDKIALVIAGLAWLATAAGLVHRLLAGSRPRPA